MIFNDPKILPISINTDQPISVVELKGTLYLFYRGTGPDTQVYYVSNANGSWSDRPTPISNLKTRLGVSAVVYNNPDNPTAHIFVVEDGSAYIEYVTFDGNNFSSVQQMPETINASRTPCAVAGTTGITVFYNGINTTNLFESVGSSD